MGSSINLSSILSALGSSSSGINVASAVAQEIALESAPMTQWQQQQAALQAQTSVINTIENDIARLQNSLNALSDPVGALTSMSAASSDTSVVNASALANTTAATHLIVVNNLATAASWYSNSVASGSTALTAGTFNLQVGSNPAKQITVGSGVNTLDQLAAYINGLSAGVSASVVNDSHGSRLALVSTTTGEASDFTVSNGAGLTFTRASEGLDASLTVDGIPMDSASNTVTGAVNGLTLNLTGAAPGRQISVSIGPDTNQVAQAIGEFVSAYNTLIGAVNSQYRVDSDHRQGVLAGDFTLSALQSALLGSGGYSGSGSIKTLASLGVSMNRDGTLTLDNSKVTSALGSNFAAVQSFFQGTSSNGFASRLDNQLDSLVNPVSGAFTVDLRSIDAQNQNLQDQIDNFQTYLDTRQAYLYEQYNKADIALQQLPILQQQIDAMLGNSSNNNKK